MDLPIAPEQPVEWAAQNDRPQPRLDRNRGSGMAVTVGRLRPCSVLDWKFMLLSHNTVRGAAGAAILNAEMLASLGKLEPLAESCDARHERARSRHGRRDAWRDASCSRVDDNCNVVGCQPLRSEQESHEPGGDEVWRHVGRGSGRHRAYRGHCCGPRGAAASSPVVVVSAMAKVTDQLLRAAAAAAQGDRTGALAISSRLRARHRDTACALVKTSAESAALCNLIEQKFDSLDEILRGLAAILELTPRISDLDRQLWRAHLEPHHRRGISRARHQRRACGCARDHHHRLAVSEGRAASTTSSRSARRSSCARC